MTSSTYTPQCPGCLRIIHFSHHETNIIQCTCGAVVNRNEEGLLLSKPINIIGHPGEIIQPGTYGSWKGRSFKVLGRLKARFVQSVFNYWTILFDDGPLGYLGEGYGLYAIFEKSNTYITSTPDDLEQLKPGDKKVFLQSHTFVLEKKSTCLKWEMEGELYLPDCTAGFTVFEFSSGNGQRITLFRFLENQSTCYEVFYTSFTGLQLTNTREYNNPVKTFSCSACGRPVSVKTFPYAQSCACSRCGARYTLDNSTDFNLYSKGEPQNKAPVIPLGSAGNIKGISYEVIGYALKEENNEDRSQWNEYTLFNAAEGYAFLSEFEGHWIYARENGDAPVLDTYDEASLIFDNKSFKLFNAYTYNAVQVEGEFPYNINVSGNTRIKEFIYPPRMWILEKDDTDGISWFSGEHVSRQEISHAFSALKSLPPRWGVGALEPNRNSMPGLRRIMLGAMLVLIVIHLVVAFTKMNSVILDNTYTFSNNSLNSVSFVTSRFYLEKWKSNLRFDITAPVNNSWLEFNATLVNTKTGSEYTIQEVLEYYQGYSNNESWTEGSTSETAYLSQVPAGTYFLQIRGSRENYGSNKVNKFRIKVTYDVSNDRNLLFGLLALLLWPVFQFFHFFYFEKNRWSNSPFSTYTYED